MKKLKLFTIALLIGTTGLFASEMSRNDVENPTIGTQIENLLNYTEFTFDNTSEVQIKFTFTSEGKIVVVKVNSNDKKVLNYIRKNLNGKEIKNPGERGKMYSLSLKLQAI
jgi:hypothetical protein